MKLGRVVRLRKSRCFFGAGLKTNIYGIATLETAIIILVTIPIILAAVALSDFLQLRREVTQSIDKFAGDFKLRPYKIADGAITFKSNEELSQKLDELVTAYNDKLANKFTTEKNPTPYYFEATMAVAKFDKSTGEYTKQIEIIATRDGHSDGYGAPKRKDEENLNIEKRIANLIEYQPGKEDKEDGEEYDKKSLYAFPLGLYGRTGAKKQYMDKVLVVGTRLFVSLKDRFLTSVYEKLGLGEEPELADIRVVIMRGSVE